MSQICILGGNAQIITISQRGGRGLPNLLEYLYYVINGQPQIKSAKYLINSCKSVSCNVNTSPLTLCWLRRVAWAKTNKIFDLKCSNWPNVTQTDEHWLSLGSPVTICWLAGFQAIKRRPAANSLIQSLTCLFSLTHSLPRLNFSHHLSLSVISMQRQSTLN